uniref:Uncharacterized protein n=1 Tax=Arundo donax TaxID=35708 RepID=A0A0A9B6A1_ARUDO
MIYLTKIFYKHKIIPLEIEMTSFTCQMILFLISMVRYIF